MRLILLRHGKAQDHGHPQGDAARALVEKGYTQARNAAHFLKKNKIIPDLVLTSPLLRAKQTAETFCESIPMPGAVIQSWLAIGMHPDTALRELSGFTEFNTVCIVGHEPDFSTLIQWIIGAEGDTIQVKKGGIHILTLNPPSRLGTLIAAIPPQLMLSRKEKAEIAYQHPQSNTSDQ